MNYSLTAFIAIICLTFTTAKADHVDNYSIGLYASVGDLNMDGSVGSSDLDAVRGSWSSDVSPYTSGDATGDGYVNSADLDIVRANWGRVVSPSASVPIVPEPATLLVWGGLALCVGVCRRGVLAGV